VDLELGLIFGVSMFLGALLGGRIALVLSTLWLRRIFIAAVLGLAMKPLLPLHAREESNNLYLSSQPAATHRPGTPREQTYAIVRQFDPLPSERLRAAYRLGQPLGPRSSRATFSQHAEIQGTILWHCRRP